MIMIIVNLIALYEENLIIPRLDMICFVFFIMSKLNKMCHILISVKLTDKRMFFKLDISKIIHNITIDKFSWK